MVKPPAPAPATDPNVDSTLQPDVVPRETSSLEPADGIASRQATTESAGPVKTAVAPIEAAGSADPGTFPREAGGANRRTLQEPAETGGIRDGVESEPTPAPETEHLSELTPAARTATLALIEALTAGFGCGRIETSLSPNRVVKLSGHLGSVEDSIALRIRLRALEHVDSDRSG
jgi:hypothetical protein